MQLQLLKEAEDLVQQVDYHQLGLDVKVVLELLNVILKLWIVILDL